MPLDNLPEKLILAKHITCIEIENDGNQIKYSQSMK